MDVRLIVEAFDVPAPQDRWNGAWNMAVDEMLLEGAAAQGRATLRFYCWNLPTVSLGYFQSAAQRLEHAASRACPWVRRATGGGAIVHDRELTYSFTLPVSRQERGAVRDVYQMFHASLAETLIHWGVRATSGSAVATSSADNWLCFQRLTPEDLVLGAAKICGSAQRRHAGSLLQHGSVLLEASPAAPELPGIAELSDCRIRPSELVGVWLERLQDGWDLYFQPEPLNAVENETATRLEFSRFKNAAWNEKR